MKKSKVFGFTIIISQGQKPASRKSVCEGKKKIRWVIFIMEVVKSYHQLFPTLSIYNEAIKLPGKSISRTPRHYQVHTLSTFLSLCKENLGMQAGRKQNQGATSPCSSTGGCQGCGQCPVAHCPWKQQTSFGDLERTGW